MKIHQVNVLCNQDRQFGEPHAIIFDEAKVLAPEQRQALATRIGLDETIFINDLSTGDISIFDTSKEIPFAGTAALAAAWLINAMLDEPLDSLTCQSRNIPVKSEGDTLWIAASLDIMPGWNHVQLDSPIAVEAITPEDAKDFKHAMVWAWMNEAEGRIRARTLASDWDIPEVEANGSGSMMLAAATGKSIEILHGKGSIILAKPAANNAAMLGGRAVEIREIVLQ